MIVTPIVPKEYRNVAPEQSLSPAESEAYTTVLQHFQSLPHEQTPESLAPAFPVTEVVDASAIPNDLENEAVEDIVGLRESERYFLTKETLIRYLTTTYWVAATAITRLTETLQFRRKWRLDRVEEVAKEVEIESRNGKVIVSGYTTTGEPLFFYRNSQNTTPPSNRKLLHNLFLLDRSIDLYGPGVQQTMLLVNFAGRAKSGGSSSLGFSVKLLNLCQAHYVNRMKSANLINVPWSVTAFVNLLWPFLSADTRSRTNTNGGGIVESGLVGKEMVPTEWGGIQEFAYTHDEYWPTLISVALQRRSENLSRWVALGGTVGLSERAFKGWGDEDEALTSFPSKSKIIAESGQTPVHYIEEDQASSPNPSTEPSASEPSTPRTLPVDDGNEHSERSSLTLVSPPGEIDEDSVSVKTPTEVPSSLIATTPPQHKAGLLGKIGHYAAAPAKVAGKGGMKMLKKNSG